MAASEADRADEGADAWTIESLRAVADEQAALRRVAELVAHGVAKEELFATVAAEASALIGGEATTLLRFDGDGCATVVATCGGRAPVGARFPVSPSDESTPATILRTGRPARVDDHGSVDRPEYEQQFRVKSSVGAPVVVEDRVWGMLGATTPDRLLPVASEQRLQQFTELIAAALANAQARADVQRLADEQAALRRVAELVARAGPPEEVFEAVTAEARAATGGHATALGRIDGDSVFVVATVGDSPAQAGATFPVVGSISEIVRETGGAVRVDDYSTMPNAPYADENELMAALAVPVTVAGRLWGVLITKSLDGPLPRGTEHRLQQFADLVSFAIANAHHRAQLTASRARVVATADATRRQLQRDVHDGAQQRLVQTVITLKLARAALGDEEGPAAALIDESLEHAGRATEELRDLVRGILPAALSRGGLRAGVESLIEGLPLPVLVDVDVPRLRPDLETTAYFVVAEALTNVVKHAGASRANVRVTLAGQTLEVLVSDDGRGGAEVGGGSGLTGILDRVEAADGTLTIASTAGAGTTVHASLPLVVGPTGGPGSG